MAVEFVHLIDDISLPVRLGWVGVLVWAAVQIVWYRRGRALPEEIEAQGEPDAWSMGSGSLSIGAALDFPVKKAPEGSDLGEAAGMALESLVEAGTGDRAPAAHQDGTTSSSRVSYQSSMSY